MVANALETRQQTGHFHVQIGFPPHADFIFDSPQEATVKFLDLADYLMSDYMAPGIRLNSEASIYRMIDSDEFEMDSGIYIQNGPFIQFLVRCSGNCRSASWN